VRLAANAARLRNRVERSGIRMLERAPGSGAVRRTLKTRKRRWLEESVADIPIWFHTIDFGAGLRTTGVKSAEQLAGELQRMRLPDLTGKRVLDIGAWDGYFTFAVERLGAAEVTALDHYAWSIDWAAHQRHAAERIARGEHTEPPHEVPGNWRPDELPGKRGFDVAHRAFRSRARAVVADFMSTDLGRLGTFDVVLFLGVLYHLTDPLGAMRRVAAVTEELAIVETEAISIPVDVERPLVEFFPFDELAGDPSNWWAPNEAAVHALCRAAGFRRVETVSGPPPRADGDLSLIRYRAVVHAHR